jgi:hypothetical protein
MNVAGRAGPFLHPRGHACFGDDRAAAWRQGGPLATALADCPVIAIVGDSAFVHAHLPAGATRDGIERLNGAAVRSRHPARRRSCGHPPLQRPTRLLRAPPFGPERRAFAAWTPEGRLRRRSGDRPKAGPDSLSLLSLPLPRLDEMRDWLLDPLAPPPRWIWGGEESPVWDRSLSVPSGGEPTTSACEALRASLQSLGVSRVIVGHTPQEQINCACSGAVWRCDTGMSRWVVGGPCEALEITADGGVPAWSKCPGSQPPARPPTDPEADSLAYRLPRAVLSAQRGALAWTPKSCRGGRPWPPTQSPFGHPDVRVLGGKRAAAAAVAPAAGQKLTAPDSKCGDDGCEISYYDVM